MARPCTICTHPKRKAIDSALVAGEAFRRVAARFGLAEASVRRHQATHVSVAAVEVVTAPAAARIAAAAEARADIAEAVVEHERKTLDLYAELRARTMGYLDQAEQAMPVVDKAGNVLGERVDWPAVASLLREARGCLEAQAKLRGELGPNVAVQVNVMASPDWHAVRGLIIDALAPHPAALADVAAALERYSAEGTSADARRG